MDAPKPTTIFELKNKEKTFETTTNKGNKFVTTFKNNGTTLLITSIYDDNVRKNFYESLYSLEKIKENKAFYIYESIDEILSELFPLIDEGKTKINEESNSINLSIDLPFQKIKTIDFIIKEKEKPDSEKINELFNIVVGQNKEINDLKKEVNILKENLTILTNKINLIEKKNNEIFNKIEQKEREEREREEREREEREREEREREERENKVDSVIINSLMNIKFIINRLNNLGKFSNKKLSLNLLYRATRDGEIETFHQNCDNKNDELVIIKTKKGIIFGGYTEIGFKNTGDYIKDENAFVFSYSKQKIYDNMKDKNAIYCSSYKGPCFSGRNYFVININAFKSQGNTCPASNSYYKGITSDYELNNGECYFDINEIEVFQIVSY